jgi:hypothetical protein
VYSAPQLRDQLWSPGGILFSESQGSFPEAWSVLLQLSLRLWMDVYLHSPYIFKAWCLIKHTGNFIIFTFIVGCMNWWVRVHVDKRKLRCHLGHTRTINLATRGYIVWRDVRALILWHFGTWTLQSAKKISFVICIIIVPLPFLLSIGINASYSNLFRSISKMLVSMQLIYVSLFSTLLDICSFVTTGAWRREACVPTGMLTNKWKKE